MKIKVLKLGLHGKKFEDEKILTWNPITSATIYVEGKNKYIIDPGHRAYSKEILDALSKEGVKPEDIDFVINTHQHLDHTSNNFLFNNARVVTRYRDTYVIWSQTEPGVDVCKVEDSIPFDEIKLIKTPGHLENHLSAIVESNGKTYVVSGDAIQEELMKTEGYADEKDKVESAWKILEIADVIIPGHDALIEGENLKELKELVAKWRS